MHGTFVFAIHSTYIANLKFPLLLLLLLLIFFIFKIFHLLFPLSIFKAYILVMYSGSLCDMWR